MESRFSRAAGPEQIPDEKLMNYEKKKGIDDVPPPQPDDAPKTTQARVVDQQLVPHAAPSSWIDQGPLMAAVLATAAAWLVARYLSKR
jgi:hypothetical protein